MHSISFSSLYIKVRLLLFILLFGCMGLSTMAPLAQADVTQADDGPYVIYYTEVGGSFWKVTVYYDNEVPYKWIWVKLDSVFTNPIPEFDPAPDDDSTIPGVNPGDEQGLLEEILKNSNFQTEVLEEIWSLPEFARFGTMPNGGLVVVWNPGDTDTHQDKVSIYQITPEAEQYWTAFGYQENGGSFNEQFLDFINSGGHGSGAPTSNTTGSGDAASDADGVSMGLSSTIYFSDAGELVVHPKANPEVSVLVNFVEVGLK